MSNPVRNDTATTSTNMNPSSDQYTSSKAADPETASIATFSSTTPLVKKDKKEKQKEKKETEVDVQKLQEQALRSQIRFSM
ncbi:hypothetical protein CDV36_007983 [Fusarium kuroshium]|uniref:Uncharacterized protein n=2 Tax=Fusarium solani species complex TaxID=232080 RepID=A0A3M2S480_9HYPO|nr:hypothetical protein CDV36_007983 [Fusarium kuroshium]RSL86038.1 hypothetical protein CEP51_003003 [Fusarium floridanum]